MKLLKRLWPVLLIVAALGIAYGLGLQSELSWASLAAHHASLAALVAGHPAGSAIAYMAVYAMSVAVSIPGSVWLTMSGGLLFGAVFGTALAVLAAGSGAVLFFLAARGALGPLIAARAPKLLDRIRPGLERDGFSYLLALRLIPVVPFWATNLAPALVGMRLAPFAAATFLGIVPATAVFASIGAGLGDVLARGEKPDLSIVFTPAVLLPLLALAALSLLPVMWRRWRTARA